MMALTRFSNTDFLKLPAKKSGGDEMYQIGDLILYGNTGICRVADITSRDLNEKKKRKLYYVLEPLYQNCTIKIPVTSTKVFMRPIISKEEASDLIDRIPEIQPKAYYNRALNQLAEHYEKSLKTHNCSDLLELCISIHTKKKEVEQQKRKFGAVDEKYMKRAEELLFGELAAALEIPKEQVPDYIAEKTSDTRMDDDKAEIEKPST